MPQGETVRDVLPGIGALLDALRGGLPPTRIAVGAWAGSLLDVVRQAFDDPGDIRWRPRPGG